MKHRKNQNNFKKYSNFYAEDFEIFDSQNFNQEQSKKLTYSSKIRFLRLELSINTGAKLDFAYTSENMTDNATKKN